MKGRSTPLILLLAFLTSTAAAEMYKWVDEQGNVHFSDSVPPDAQDAESYKARKTQSDFERERNEARRRADQAQERKIQSILDGSREREWRRAQEEAQEKRERQRCATLRERLEQVLPGQPDYEAMKIMNSYPLTTHKTRSFGGDREQVVFGNDQCRYYLYTLNGIVTSVSTSD